MVDALGCLLLRWVFIWRVAWADIERGRGDLIMGRYKKGELDKFLDETFVLLKGLPWWGTPLVAGIWFIFFAAVIPIIFSVMGSVSPIAGAVLGIFSQVSILFSFLTVPLVVVIGLMAAVHRKRNGRMLDAQTGAESLRALDWRSFERLLEEAFRREGYGVEEAGGRGPDGGVDLRLYREGATTLVQCKHWKVQRVGVKVVRELRGVMAAEGAEGGVVVTSGGFTGDAKAFARESGIRLIDGSALWPMIRRVQQSAQRGVDGPSERGAPPMPAAACGVESTSLAPACPACGGAMVVRTARRGPNAGRAFWGCRAYPRCRGIVNVVDG